MIQVGDRIITTVVVAQFPIGTTGMVAGHSFNYGEYWIQLNIGKGNEIICALTAKEIQVLDQDIREIRLILKF